MVSRDPETHEFSFELGPEKLFLFLDFWSVSPFRNLPIVISSLILIKIENFLKKGNRSRCKRLQVSFKPRLFGHFSSPMTLFVVAVPANFDRASFDPRYFMKEDVTEQKIFHTRHPTMKKFCGGLPGSPLFCEM